MLLALDEKSQCVTGAVTVLQSEDVEDLFEKIEDARLQLRHSDARRLFGDEDDAGEKTSCDAHAAAAAFPESVTITDGKAEVVTEVEKLWLPK